MAATGVVLNDSMMAWINAALLAGVVVCIAVRVAVVRCRGLTRRRGLERLHPVELAYVTGRHDHALLVAALRLLESGLIVPHGPIPVAGALSSERQLETSGCVTSWAVNARQTDRAGEHDAGTGHHLHPLELAVLKALGEADESTDMTRIWSNVKWSYAMGQTGERLASLGFVADRTTKRTIYAGGAWLVAMLGVALVIPFAGFRASATSVPWNLAAVCVGAGVARGCLKMPSQMPAALRMISRARAPHRSLLRDAGQGADRRIALAKLGRDPAAVAAFGPNFVWRWDPALAASLGFSPPPTRRKKSSAKAAGGAALVVLALEATTPG